MNRDELEGKAKDLKGRMKEAAGDVANNDRLKNEGAADQAEGQVQDTMGRGRRKAGEFIEDIGKSIKR